MAASLVSVASTPPTPFTTNRPLNIASNVRKFYKLSSSGTHMLFDHSDQVIQTVDSLSPEPSLQHTKATVRSELSVESISCLPVSLHYFYSAPSSCRHVFAQNLNLQQFTTRQFTTLSKLIKFRVFIEVHQLLRIASSSSRVGIGEITIRLGSCNLVGTTVLK